MKSVTENVVSSVLGQHHRHAIIEHVEDDTVHIVIKKSSWNSSLWHTSWRTRSFLVRNFIQHFCILL